MRCPTFRDRVDSGLLIGRASSLTSERSLQVQGFFLVPLEEKEEQQGAPREKASVPYNPFSGLVSHTGCGLANC